MVKESKQNNQLPENSLAYWTNSTKLNKFPALDTHIHVDVCIVGGGITGITAAYELIKSGKSVVLIEADELLQGTTGHTSAKVTTQHGLIYDQLIQTVGKEAAKVYYEANQHAAQWMDKIITSKQIVCDYKRESAYLYASTDQGAEEIKQEFAAYEELQIPGEYVSEIPLGIPIKAGIHLPNQARFHPLHYMKYLLEAYIEAGGQVYEKTTAVNIQGNKVYMESDYTATADKILICTHYPFYEGKGLYATRLYASRSYVLAAQTKHPYPGGMYINVEKPDRSLRSVTIDGSEHILIVGESHRTGDTNDAMEHYEALKQYGVELFGLNRIAYRWSAQDLTTLDQIPYIGPITKENSHILIATGYRKWGMTNGTAAALLLADIVLEKENPLLELVHPSRKLSLTSAKHAVERNWVVTKKLLGGKLTQAKETIEEMAVDSGAIVAIDGEKKGVYKNQAGDIYIVDTTCTHIGCEVAWNNAEKSWDCPCHGSRFSYTGEVLEGPAEKPLKTYDYHMIDNITSDESGY